MRRIKLFFVRHDYVNEYESRRVLSEGISNWEEVSDEDYEYILKNRHIFTRILKNPVTVVEEYTDPIPELVVDIKKAIQKEIEADRKLIEKEREERLKKNLEKEKVSAAKKLERARAKIAELEALVKKEEEK